MTAKATIGIRYFADRDNNTENRYITSTLATFALVSIILCTCRLSIFAIRAHVQCGFPTKAMISQVDLHFAFHDLHKVRGKQNHSAVGVFWGGGGGLCPVVSFTCICLFGQLLNVIFPMKSKLRPLLWLLYWEKKALFYLLIKIRSRLTRL